MQERGKHQCHKEEREQTACLQAFSSESAPAILFATNLSSRNQMIIFNLVDMIINAWLMFNACQVCLLRAVENLGKILLIAPSTQVDTMQNMRIWIQALLDLGVTKHLNLSNLVFSEPRHLMLTRNLSHKNVLAPKTEKNRSASLVYFANLCQ